MTHVDNGRFRLWLIAKCCVGLLVVWCCIWIVPLLADENPTLLGPRNGDVKEWIEQLRAPSYAQRKQAFLELCNPSLNIDEWASGLGVTEDPQLQSLVTWLQRIRKIPGSLDSRLDAVCDFPSLAQGSVEVVERYAKQGKLELLLEMLRLVPRSGRDMLLQNTFTRGDNSFDYVFDKAWEFRREDLIPKFLDTMLPMHPVRIGLNRRWRMLGLGPQWKLDVQLDSSDMQIAALESEGQIDQAVQLARQVTQPGTVEKILLRNQRWDAWLSLDPARLSMIPAAWSEIPRVLILEALDRHEEALGYYEVRRRTIGKPGEQQLLLAQLALVMGDMHQVFKSLEEHSPDQLMGMYFLHNRIDQLFESEGLTTRNEASMASWLDRNVVEGKGLSKPTRFQALFQRIGETQWSDRIQQRIVSFIESHAPDQQIRFWKEYLQQVMRFGMDEKRAELLAIAAAKLDFEGAKASNGRSVAGFPEAQVEKDLTVEDLFRESFPFMKESAYPLFRVMRISFPGKTNLQILEVLQMLHQGVIPEGFEQSQIRKLYLDAVTYRILDGGSPSGTVVDLAESMDAIGNIDLAIELLESIPGDLRAELMRSQLLFKKGDYQQARRVVLSSMEQGAHSLEIYQWGSYLLGQIEDGSLRELLEHRVLSRPSGMEDFARYTQEMRRTERLEFSDPIGRFLEVQLDSFPSSLGNIWLDEIYWGWNLSLLANYYHQTAPETPERVVRNFDLALGSCLFELFNEFDSPMGMNLRLARGNSSNGWDLDWSQWAWRYERVYAAAFWRAVRQGDREQAERFLRAAHQINPEQINTLINSVPWVLEKFGQETLSEWFQIYYQPMQEHLKRYPQDTMVANNCAWIAVKCGVQLDKALELSEMVTKLQPTDTYLDTLAEVYFVRGDVDKAIEISLKCQQLNPRDPHHRRQLERYNQKRRSVR